MMAIGIYALIVVNICVLLFGKYLFSYVKKKSENLAEKEDLKEIKSLSGFWSKKGENLATKEDIKEITQIVERVKTDFAHETEFLKANLQLLTSTKQSLINEERSALLKFYENFGCWVNLMTDLTLSGKHPNDTDNLNQHQARINDAYFQLLLSEARMTFFLQDEELLRIKDKMKVEVMTRFQQPLGACILNMMKNNMTINAASPDLVVKNLECIANYSKAVLAGHAVLNPLLHEFQAKARKHLYRSS